MLGKHFSNHINYYGPAILWICFSQILEIMLLENALALTAGYGIAYYLHFKSKGYGNRLS